MTWRSFVGTISPISTCDMLDGMTASASKKLLNTQSNFRKRVSVEEQRAQNSDRFLRGRQIAYMIYEYFRATGAYEAEQGLSNLFSFSLQKDDVQDVDVRWDQTQVLASEMPSDVILEGFFKSKLQSFDQLQTVLALYDQETARNKGKPNCSQLKTAVKLHIDQMLRTRNFRVRNEVVERRSESKSQNGRKASVERTVGECCQWKANGQCSKGDSCSFSHDKIASGSSGSGQTRKGRWSSPASLTARKRKSLWTRVKFHAGSNSKKKKSCKFWHPPVCQNYKSEKGCVHGDKCHF